MPTDDREPGADAVEPDVTSTLDIHQCWEFLRSAEVGRVALVFDGGPEIYPVNFVVDHGTVVFRTGEGTRLAGVGTGHPVAFEVDGGDRRSGEAWSVIIKGRASTISAVHELFDVGDLPLFPWDIAPKHRFIRIVPDEVTGRRFSIAERETWPVGPLGPRSSAE